MAVCKGYVAGGISPEEFAWALLQGQGHQESSSWKLPLVLPNDGVCQQRSQFLSSGQSAKIVGAWRLPGAATVFTSVLGVSGSSAVELESLLSTVSTCLFHLSEDLNAAIVGRACSDGLPVGLKALFVSGLHTALFRCAALEEVGEGSDLVDALHCVFFFHARRFTAFMDATQSLWVKAVRDCIGAAKALAQWPCDHVHHWSTVMMVVSSIRDVSKSYAPTWVTAFYLHGIISAQQEVSNRGNTVGAEATAILDLLVVFASSAQRRCWEHRELFHVRSVLASGLERLRACEVARRRWNSCPGYCESRMSA